MTANEKTVAAALRVLRGETGSPGPHFVTGAQAARILGISKSTFQRWSRVAGLRPVEVVPGRFRYRRQTIETFATSAGAKS